MSQAVLDRIQSENIQCIDLKFCDIHGSWQHLSIPAAEFDMGAFNEGVGFDGSSIRGWQNIEASDMVLMPQAHTAWLDPFIEAPSLHLICDVHEPDGTPYALSPRAIAKKAEAWLQKSNVADTAYFGPEAEFFIFDEVRYRSDIQAAGYQVNSEEAAWNTNAEEYPNQGYKIPYKQGYLPVPPSDKHMDLRNEMVQLLQGIGLRVECQHHEVATAGQSEINLRFNSLLNMADDLCAYKYIVKNAAFRNGKTATFMPKPIYGDNGNGMHVNQSLWKGKQPLFPGDTYANLSQEALYYIGGLLHHAPALCAIANPTTNSYKRLVPGFEAPVSLAYSARNRSVICRIPVYSSNPKALRIEFRSPDPSANPYLLFPALLLAGMDGIRNKMDPGKPCEVNLYKASAEKLAEYPTVPASLSEALAALKADCQFLFEGDVFTQDFIDNYIGIKQRECDAVSQRPHPHEYALYYDV